MLNLRIYLDNCCYNRPYDDQSQLRISIETQAKLFLQEQISIGKIELVSSYVLNAENSMNKISSKRENIRAFINENTSCYVSAVHKNEIEKEAISIMDKGAKFIDACHVACAIFAKCDYFVSTDDRLLKCKIDKIKLINPVNIIMELEEF